MKDLYMQCAPFLKFLERFEFTSPNHDVSRFNRKMGLLIRRMLLAYP
jgi:hypothetical protein